MDLIKLLDVSNPKKIKDTINLLIENYEGFGDDIRAIADQAAEDSAAALLAGNEAKQIAQNSATTLLQSITQQNNIISQNFEEQDEEIAEAIATQNTTIQQNKAEQDATIEAAFEVQDAKLNAQDEEIAQNTTTSDQAKQIAEEALAMIEQADARSLAATETAEDALALANESIETSELAMNVATDAKSTVDQAISTGVFGTFVHNPAGVSLLHAYMTDNLEQENTDDYFYMATPKLVRDALTNYYTKDEAAAKTDIPTEYLVKAVDGVYTLDSFADHTGIYMERQDGAKKGIYFKNADFACSTSGPHPNSYRIFSLKDVVRTTDTDQEIAGIKNYTGGLQKNSIDVATVNDIPQAVTVTLTETQNFNDIVISNEQFELLLSNPENYLIIETSNGSLTISLKYRRSQYFTMTSGNVLQEALIFNCVNSTSFAPYAERIDSMTLIRQTQNGETNIVVQDDTLDFTTFVPKTRTINGKSLSNDITLTATDVNALPDTTEIPTALSDLNEDSSHRTVTDAEKTTWNNKSNFSGSYNDLTDKPIIPTALSELSEDSTHRLVTDNEKETWNAKSNFSGSYNDLTDKPTIPTININGASQSTINFDSDPQTQITGLDTNKVDWEQLDFNGRLIRFSKQDAGFFIRFYDSAEADFNKVISLIGMRYNSTNGGNIMLNSFDGLGNLINSLEINNNGVSINDTAISNTVPTTNGFYIDIYNGIRILVESVDIPKNGTVNFDVAFLSGTTPYIVGTECESDSSYKNYAIVALNNTSLRIYNDRSLRWNFIAMGKWK